MSIWGVRVSMKLVAIAVLAVIAGAVIPLAMKPPAREITLVVRGIAFDGGQGIREVAYSTDGGRSWREAKLASDLGRYSFSGFTFAFLPERGEHDLRVRAWNRSGSSQPMEALWQPAGYMRNVVESVKVIAG